MSVAVAASPTAGRTAASHVELLGVAIDCLDMEQTVARCEAIVESGRYAQHVVVNAAKMVAIHDDPALRRIVEDCAIVNADGQSVVWAARLLGRRLPERVAGIDLMHELMDLCARRGWSAYVLGARPAVLERALARLREDHPGLRVDGRDGYFAPEDVGQVVAEIARSRAEILFVAMPSPAKEEFLAAHGEGLGVALAMGVGGAIDVCAGVTRRAPLLWQRLGLEWAYRMLQEPKRLFGRYAKTNGRFVRLVLAERMRSRAARRAG